MKKLVLTTLENSRRYTLEVAEAMPEQFYDTRPLAAVWSFGELLDHIAYGIEWWTSNNIQKVKMAWTPPATEKDKDNVIAYLNQAYSTLNKTMEKIELDDTTILGFLSTLDHVTHHRGQAVTYLRCKNIVAPEYTY